MIRAPDVLSNILLDSTASARHRIDSAKTLNDFAANGPAGAPASGTFFEITINLGSDVEGKPVIEHYRKPLAIDTNPNSPEDSETNDIDPFNDVDTGVIAVIAAKKSTDGGNGEPI